MLTKILPSRGDILQSLGLLEAGLRLTEALIALVQDAPCLTFMRFILPLPLVLPPQARNLSAEAFPKSMPITLLPTLGKIVVLSANG